MYYIRLYLGILSYYFGRLSVWKIQKSEPSMSLGYGYMSAGATDK